MRNSTLDVLLEKTAEDDEEMREWHKELDAMAGADHEKTRTVALRNNFIRELVRASHDAPLEKYKVLHEGDLGPHAWEDHPASIPMSFPGMESMLESAIGKEHAKEHLEARRAGDTVLGINPGRNPAVIAHEIGHSTRPGMYDKLTYNASAWLNHPASVLGSLGFMGAGALLGKPGLAIAGAVPSVLGSIAELAEEHRASQRARELLKRMAYQPTTQELKGLDDAYGTYVSSAAQSSTLPALAVISSFLRRAGR
jgi:topoisomerase IA-like protein